MLADPAAPTQRLKKLIVVQFEFPERAVNGVTPGGKRDREAAVPSEGT